MDKTKIRIIIMIIIIIIIIIRKSTDYRFKNVCTGALSMIFGDFGWHIIKTWKYGQF